MDPQKCQALLWGPPKKGTPNFGKPPNRLLHPWIRPHPSHPRMVAGRHRELIGAAVLGVALVRNFWLAANEGRSRKENGSYCITKGSTPEVKKAPSSL